ncbi:MAG: YkgJ family cysteine cluster protein [Blastocatellia bacterium]
MATERTEFGFRRIVCACRACARFCFTLPGNLIPSDLQRMADHLKEPDIVRFALDNLLASPGAIVAVNGVCFSIPTLVPARKPDGSCRFLKNGRCTIHADAPYGCAYFSMEQPKHEADARSARGLMEIARAWQRGDLYAQLWLMLHEAGRIAPSPIEARARMQAAMDDTPNDLSECELQELEDEAIRELREEGLLRPRLVNFTERDAQTDSSDANPPNWPGAF